MFGLAQVSAHIFTSVGDYFQWIAAIDVRAEDADRVADHLLDWLWSQEVVVRELSPCLLSRTELGYMPGSRFLRAVAEPDDHEPWAGGVELVHSKRVFHPMQGVLDPIRCPVCGQEVEFTALETPMMSWWESNDGPSECPHCGSTVGINDWLWASQFAFAYLGLEFWNWPALSPDFVDQVGQRTGSRVVLGTGKV